MGCSLIRRLRTNDAGCAGHSFTAWRAVSLFIRPRKTRFGPILPYVELRRLEDFDAEDPSGTSALSGAAALLAALPTRSWVIVTSAPARLAKTRLQFAGITVPHNLVSVDDVSRGKPDPEPYELGARKLGLEPSECLVIEDSPAGIKAGKAAGCKTLAVYPRTRSIRWWRPIGSFHR